MADIKISALPGASTLTGAETIPLDQGGTTKKVTTDQFLTKDASGNVGVGVTPSGNFTLQAKSSFTDGFKGFLLGGFRGGASGAGYPWVGYNIRPTSTSDAYVYDVGDVVSAIKFADGISFNVAPSGTAGNAISWTQAMTLDAAGSLCVTGGVFRAATDGGATFFAEGAQHVFRRGPSGSYAEFGRFDASGSLGIGTNNPSAYGLLTINGASASANVNATTGAASYWLYEGAGTARGRIASLNGSNGLALFYGTTEGVRMDASGHLTPGGDNTQTLGSGAKRWSTVYAGTGTINTSDAREKTDVRVMAADEIEAAKALSKEIGIYQFLDSVAKKGDKARHHVGLTVQRAIELMKLHGLDPFAYGLICFDKWDDVVVEHPAVEAKAATEAKDEVVDAEGNVIEAAVEAQAAIEAKDAWAEVTLKAGDRYSFRYDQLNLFIARGIEARLAAREAK